MIEGLVPYPFALLAGQQLHVPIEGDFFLVHRATGPVTIQTDGVEPAEYVAGEGGPRRYRQLTLKAENGATSGTMLVGFTDGKQVLTATQVFGEVDTELQLPNTLTGLADVNVPAGTAVKLADANDARRVLNITPDLDAAGLIRIGGNGSVGLAIGTPAYPGQTVGVENTGEIWAYNPQVTDITVYRSEETL